MALTISDVFYLVALMLGILGNMLVIICNMRKKHQLKNNYHFVVLHLGICDPRLLVVKLVFISYWCYAKDWFFRSRLIYCLSRYVWLVFQFTGIYMMLVIATLRYLAAVHPLKHDIRQRKLKVICCLGYMLGLIVEWGTSASRCFLQKNDVDHVLK